MTNIDDRLDALFLQYHGELKHGLNELAGHGTAEEQLKQALKTEIARAKIEELERTMPFTDGMRHYNTVKARISELSKEVKE